MASIIKSYSIDKDISDGLKHLSKPVPLSVLLQIMLAALVYQIKHPKCDHKEAWFWTSQTRAGDEAETKFFKCTKCRHTWREYR